MKVYVVVYDRDEYSSDYIGVYSSKEKAEKSIERDIVRRFDYSPMYDNYNDLRRSYDIIEDEIV